MPASALADTVAVLVATGLASSNGDARRTLGQGGVRANGRKLGPDDIVRDLALLDGRFLLLRKGRTTYHLVEVTP